ncbi:hypothetical protein MMC13_002226 [Lambiella insularis]|nr:hypothetical protein [Lambiella insularis]
MASNDVWSCSACESTNLDAFALDSCAFCSNPRSNSIPDLIDISAEPAPTPPDLIDTSAEAAEASVEPAPPRSLSVSSGSSVPAHRSNSESAVRRDASGIQPLHRTFRAMSNAAPAYHDNVSHYNKEFYDKWWKERSEAIARGEDPYARYRLLVAARNEQKTSTKLKRMFSKEKSYTRSAPVRLNQEEEAQARKRDTAMLKQHSGGTVADG